MGGHQSLQEGPLAWGKLCLDMVYIKSKYALLKVNHLEKMSISLDDKEQDVSEYLKREKGANRARRYKGSISTDSVEYTTSLSGDLSTLTSQKTFSQNIGLKPDSIFQYKRGEYFCVLFFFTLTQQTTPSLLFFIKDSYKLRGGVGEDILHPSLKLAGDGRNIAKDCDTITGA